MVLNEQFSLVCGARVCRDQSCVWVQLLNVASDAQEIDGETADSRCSGA